MEIYRVEDVVDRIAAVLGERPSVNQVHKAVSGGATRVRSSAVAGLPAALDRPTGGRATLQWDAKVVETWLADHPRVRLERALSELDARACELAESGRRAGEVAMIRWARESGLSWAQIAAALSRARGVQVTRQAVAQRFSRLS